MASSICPATQANHTRFANTVRTPDLVDSLDAHVSEQIGIVLHLFACPAEMRLFSVNTGMQLPSEKAFMEGDFSSVKFQKTEQLPAHCRIRQGAPRL
jgi:hypothetical protein